MDNLPEDCQRLIWKHVYDGNIEHIEEGYAKWARKRRRNLQWKRTTDYDTYINIINPIERYYFKEVCDIYQRRRDLNWE
jgi:hypothetical protein